jgi:lysophospholipase L1-like esterase
MGIVKRFASEDYVEQNFQNFKDEVILTTPQTLTEEQKNQVKENLGIITQEPENTDPVTTEYVYSYDGDNTSDTNSWVFNYGGTKVFVKLGELPEGELNLIGSSIFRTNPNNQWLDRTFTITEEHLTKVLNKANTDIPATQEGLIQIFDLMNSDFSEFTVLCICTQPGWYNVTFDDWYEIIEFKEAGIYGYDKRTYGGNDYLKTFTFSATVTPENGNAGNGGNTSKPTTPIQYTGNEIQVFSRGICIGDSVTEGSFDDEANGIIVKRFAYPAILQRLTNIDIVNAGIAGATTSSWYEASLNSDTQWGKWLNNEWIWDTNPTATPTDSVSSELDYSNFDFAFIHLGINDYNENLTNEQIATNFETNINTIISKLKTSSSGIKIFLSTIIPTYAPSYNETYKVMNQKIREMTENAENVFLVDLNKYSELASRSEYSVSHPTALGYHKMANEIKAYISYIIGNNLSKFTDIQFIK